MILRKFLLLIVLVSLVVNVLGVAIVFKWQSDVRALQQQVADKDEIIQALQSENDSLNDSLQVRKQTDVVVMTTDVAVGHLIGATATEICQRPVDSVPTNAVISKPIFSKAPLWACAPLTKGEILTWQKLTFDKPYLTVRPGYQICAVKCLVNAHGWVGDFRVRDEETGRVLHEGINVRFAGNWAVGVRSSSVVHSTKNVWWVALEVTPEQAKDLEERQRKGQTFFLDHPPPKEDFM